MALTSETEFDKKDCLMITECGKIELLVTNFAIYSTSSFPAIPA